jgi:hypothetical protein
VPIDHDRRRSRDVLTLVAAMGVEQAVALRHRQVAIREESVARAQLLGQLLALLVRIGTDRQDLDAFVTELGQDGSKTLELRDAERSPVAAVEDEHDGRALAE